LKKTEAELPEEELTGQEPTPPDLNLHEYVALVRRHWPILALSLGVALAVALGHWALATRLYRATVVINVERERAAVGDIKSSDENGRDMDTEFLQTQMRLLKSREVAERVVRNVRLSTPASGAEKGKPPEAENQPDQNTRAALAVQKRVEVNAVRNTTLLELSYVSPSPVDAARLANAVAAAYIDWRLEARVRSLNERVEFFLSQIAQVKKDLDEKEQKLLTYGREKDIVGDLEKSSSFQNLDAVSRDYSAAVADRVSKEARYQELRTAPPDAIANTLSSGLVAQLQAEQAKLEREYAEKLGIYKPEWPAMQQLKTQIDKGRQNLDAVIQDTVNKARESARSDYMTALRRETTLKSALQSQKTEAQAASSDAIGYNNLKVEVQTQRALLDTLLRREAETEVLSRLQGERASSVRIVDRALVPLTPFAPSVAKDLLLGLALGGFVGAGLILLMSQLDRSLRSPSQVREALGLPTLVVVPGRVEAARGRYPGRFYPRRKAGEDEAGKTLPELVAVQRPRTPMAEAYRELRTSLLLSRAGGIRSMVVTSANQREGKTTLASNLAIVLAQLDKTVVLVDGDLHHPRLHEVFGVSNRLGLASVVAGQINFLEALVATSVPGVTLFPAGPCPPDPSVLLASGSMSGLLTALGSSFDFVVIDAPPVGAVTDAVLLAAQADGAIVCVRAARTPRELSMSCRDKLLWSGARILGVALTMGDDDTRAGYYDSYYNQAAGGADRTAGEAAQGG
jgi:succinoglycan biosynthesis transport protein ExoP